MSLHIFFFAHLLRNLLDLESVGHLHRRVEEVEILGVVAHDEHRHGEQEEGEEGVEEEEAVIRLPVVDGGPRQPVLRLVGVLGAGQVHREQEASYQHGQDYNL